MGIWGEMKFASLTRTVAQLVLVLGLNPTLEAHRCWANFGGVSTPPLTSFAAFMVGAPSKEQLPPHLHQAQHKKAVGRADALSSCSWERRIEST